MPLRVAITARSVYPLHSVGGLERHMHDLIVHLAAAGVGVHVVTRPPTSTPPAGVQAFASPLIDWSFVPYRTFPLAGRRGTTVLDRSTAYPLFGLRAGARVARLVTDGAVDVVYGHGASVLGYARAKRRGLVTAPLIFNPHGLEEFGQQAGQGRLKRWAYGPLRTAVRQCVRESAFVIAEDTALMAPVMRHLRVPAGRVRLVPNTVDLDACDAAAESALAPRLRAKAGIPDGGILLLSTGRVEENKGFHVLARALADLKDIADLPPWRWVLVGNGPFRPRVEQAVREVGLGDRAVLTGFVPTDELLGWYRAADVFVHPTLYEGSSIVTLEAMARELPVVATNAGGLPDKVFPGVNGWLVDPGRVDQLTAAIGDALHARATLAAKGLASRRIVEERFSWGAATHALIDVFEDALR